MRAQQLHETAELYETYPTLLKKAADPAEEPRKNIKHITDRFHGTAQRFSKTKPENCFAQIRHQFAAVHFPVVPFDHLLVMFLSTLDRHPLLSVRKPAESSRTQCGPSTNQDTIQALDRQTAKLTLNARPTSSPPERTYPPEIVLAIEEALQGLPYIYTVTSPLSLDIAAKVPRTKYTPYSAPSLQSIGLSRKGAIFTVPYHSHLAEVYNGDKLDMSPRNEMSKPYDGRELQWLKAFLKACDFMMKMDK